MRMKIKPVAQCYISAAIVETAKNWEAHHVDVMNTANKLKDNGGVLSISELETGLTHNRATSVIWFMQRSK